jgi:hypothetical protein
MPLLRSGRCPEEITIRHWPPWRYSCVIINSVFFETIIESASEPRDRARFSREMCASDQTQPNLRQQAIPAGRLLYFPADILIQRLL